MNAQSELISITRILINGEQNVERFRIIDWNSIIELARKQCLLVYVYLFTKLIGEDNRPSNTIMRKLKQSYVLEIARNVRQLNAINDLRKAFEREGINNLFFKGAVTKKRYGNELLRSMGDIDFLYNPEQEKKMRKVMNEVGFEWDHRGRVHDVLRRESDVLVEAHRQLLPSNSPYYSFGEGIWKRARNVDNCSYSFEMSIEDEIVFNIIHLASHFRKGGAGIRYIIDAWVYEQLSTDKSLIMSKLETLNLVKFYDNVLLLARKWFGDNSDSSEDCQLPIVAKMEGYILFGGIFGSSSISSDAVIMKGKACYLKNVIFPNYKEMKSMYPWLKQKMLLPCAWLLRGIESLLWRRKNIQALLKPIILGNTQNTHLESFYQECGLM